MTVLQNLRSRYFDMNLHTVWVDEGFDMITFYNMHGALLGIDYEKG